MNSELQVYNAFIDNDFVAFNHLLAATKIKNKIIILHVFHHGAENNNTLFIKKLFSNSPDAVLSCNFNTVFCNAIRYNSIDVVKFMLSVGCVSPPTISLESAIRKSNNLFMLKLLYAYDFKLHINGTTELGDLSKNYINGIVTAKQLRNELMISSNAAQIFAITIFACDDFLVLEN